MSADRIIGIAGLVIAILGIIIGYILYRTGLKPKELTYTISDNNLIQDNVTRLSGLRVSYKGQKVDTLTVSKIYIWNSRYGTIIRDDLVSTDPLRIICSDNSKILDANVIKTTHLPNQVVTIQDATKVDARLEFEYLERNQGAIIQVIHTEINSINLKLTGSIKGTSIRNANSKTPPTLIMIIYPMMIIMIFLVFVVGTYIFRPIMSLFWLAVLTGVVATLIPLPLVLMFFTFGKNNKHWWITNPPRGL